MLSDKKSSGLYRKFDISRVDGTDAPGCRHFGCEYFTLDMTHDKYAPPAMRAYADACESDLPDLARDLRERAASLEEMLGLTERHSREPMTTVTLRQIMDADVWSEYCDEYGLSPWAINEGMDDETEVEVPATSDIAIAVCRHVSRMRRKQ